MIYDSPWTPCCVVDVHVGVVEVVVVVVVVGVPSDETCTTGNKIKIEMEMGMWSTVGVDQYCVRGYGTVGRVFAFDNTDL